MLVSVAAYPLWLHWRPWGCGWRGGFWTTSPAFTGARCRCRPAPPASTPRVYNPIKQAQDHDPHGVSCRWPFRCGACPMPGCSSLAHAARGASALWRTRWAGHCDAIGRSGQRHQDRQGALYTPCATRNRYVRPKQRSWKTRLAPGAPPPAAASCRSPPQQTWIFEPCTASRICRKSTACAARLCMAQKNGPRCGTR